jgi:hypothetical protein
MAPSREPMPSLMKELHRMEFDYAHGKGIDFEPYREFMSAEEASDWFRAWTGNPSVRGSEYLVFGQDGTGGLAAFWCARPDDDLLEQPIVFFGSEGELGIVANNFRDFLWLLAGGLGPYEAVTSPGVARLIQPHLSAFAAIHAPENEQTVAEVLARAQAAFPDFEKHVRLLVR